jgi:hypothetical protein
VVDPPPGPHDQLGDVAGVATGPDHDDRELVPVDRDDHAHGRRP